MSRWDSTLQCLRKIFHRQSKGVLTIHYGDIPKDTWSGSFIIFRKLMQGVDYKRLLDWQRIFRSHRLWRTSAENFASSRLPFLLTNRIMKPVSGLILHRQISFTEFVFTERIQSFEDNNSKICRASASYTFNDKISLNYSNYIGRWFSEETAYLTSGFIIIFMQIIK